MAGESPTCSPHLDIRIAEVGEHPLEHSLAHVTQRIQGRDRKDGARKRRGSYTRRSGTPRSSDSRAVQWVPQGCGGPSHHPPARGGCNALIRPPFQPLASLFAAQTSVGGVQRGEHCGGGAFPLFLVPDAVEDLGKRPGGSERDYGSTRSPAGLWVRRWKRRVGTDPMRDQRVRFGCPWASSGHEGASNGSFAWQANASANRVRAGQRPTAGRIR